MTPAQRALEAAKATHIVKSVDQNGMVHMPYKTLIAILEELYADLYPALDVEREFTNELGNRIKITIEGPTSVSENILTPKEFDELAAAIFQRREAAVSERAGGPDDDRQLVARHLGVIPLKGVIGMPRDARAALTRLLTPSDREA